MSWSLQLYFKSSLASRVIPTTCMSSLTISFNHAYCLPPHASSSIPSFSPLHVSKSIPAELNRCCLNFFHPCQTPTSLVVSTSASYVFLSSMCPTHVAKLVSLPFVDTCFLKDWTYIMMFCLNMSLMAIFVWQKFYSDNEWISKTVLLRAFLKT